MIDEATFPLSNSGSLTVSQGHAECTISRTESDPVRVTVFMKMKEYAQSYGMVGVVTVLIPSHQTKCN